MEWNIDIIFPVVVEMMTVAELNLSSIMALDEASTVISEDEVRARSSGSSSMECGVLVPVTKGAILISMRRLPVYVYNDLCRRMLALVLQQVEVLKLRL